jgi:hypothetical protein
VGCHSAVQEPICLPLLPMLVGCSGNHGDIPCFTYQGSRNVRVPSVHALPMHALLFCLHVMFRHIQCIHGQ